MSLFFLTEELRVPLSKFWWKYSFERKDLRRIFKTDSFPCSFSPWDWLTRPIWNTNPIVPGCLRSCTKITVTLWPFSMVDLSWFTGEFNLCCSICEESWKFTFRGRLLFHVFSKFHFFPGSNPIEKSLSGPARPLISLKPWDDTIVTRCQMRRNRMPSTFS